MIVTPCATESCVERTGPEPSGARALQPQEAVHSLPADPAAASDEHRTERGPLPTGFRRHRGTGGFSAVELIVALVILAGLAAIFMPALGRTEPRKSVASARNAFASLHATARASAIQYGRMTRLRIQPPSRMWVEVTNSAGGIDTLGRVMHLDKEFNRVTVSATSLTLCYGPRGLPVVATGCSSPGDTVTFSKHDIVDTVFISPAGRLLR